MSDISWEIDEKRKYKLTFLKMFHRALKLIQIRRVCLDHIEENRLNNYCSN